MNSYCLFAGVFVFLGGGARFRVNILLRLKRCKGFYLKIGTKILKQSETTKMKCFDAFEREKKIKINFVAP